MASAASVAAFLVFFFMAASSSTNCPSICICKWKNGKRWVECKNANQISIPDGIDIETQVLDLSGNNLQILPREVFARHGLLNLQKLHLTDCRIGQIDPSAFRGLTNLVELNLAGNLLTSVPTATFSDIPYLRELHLERNPLGKIEANAFEMIPQLVSLDLSHCGLKRVAAKAFAQLASLEKLFLQHNQISELRQKTVESITGLHAVELSSNPWACDCRLRPLKHWLVSNNVPHSVDPKCASPPRLAGQQFANLQVDEFACPPELLSAPRYVEANVGENATLSCKIGSVPTSKIQWYRDGQEVLNNSLVNRGLQKFLIYENGSFEKTSTLVLTNVRPEDSGPFMCVSLNQAGRVEANFTLQVGYFVGGVASLESSQIAGIAVTFTAIAIVLLVLALVFLVRQRGKCVNLRQSSASLNKTAQNGHHVVIQEKAENSMNQTNANENGTQEPNVTSFVQHQPPQLNTHVNGGHFATAVAASNSPDLIRIQKQHSYENQAVNYSPAHYNQQLQQQHHHTLVRPTPNRLATHIDADQLYPNTDYNYSTSNNGYFNPLEAVTSSPLRGHSPFRTLPRPPQPHIYDNGGVVAINPLRDYGYPSDFGLPMTSSSLTFNPLNELDEDEDFLGQGQRAGPMLPPSSGHKMNLSTNSSTGSSTLSPPRGQLSSSGIGGDLSTTSGTSNCDPSHNYRGSPTGLLTSTPTPTGSSSSSSGNNGLYAKVNKRPPLRPMNNNPKRESPDEGIDVSTSEV